MGDLPSVWVIGGGVSAHTPCKALRHISKPSISFEPASLAA
jgi:hypothetical protein